MTIRPPLLAGLILAVGLVPAVRADRLDDAATQVRAAHAALESARADFASEQASGRLSATEQADYRRYVARLAERVREGCDDYLLAGGEPAALGAACRDGAPAPARAAAIDPGAEHTQAERISDAEAELRSAMGEFDQQLLRDQARVRAKADGVHDGHDGGRSERDAGERKGGADGGDTGGSTADAGHQDPSQGDRDADRQTDRKPDRNAERGDQRPRPGTPPPGDGRKRDGAGQPPPGSGGGHGAEGGPGAIPEDIPDANGDDVIARQLREAAEHESDPELRARLWDEYRRYKDEQSR